jgi:hypothetical protein
MSRQRYTLPVLMKELQKFTTLFYISSYRIVTESLGIIRVIIHRLSESPIPSGFPAVPLLQCRKAASKKVSIAPIGVLVWIKQRFYWTIPVVRLTTHRRAVPFNQLSSPTSWSFLLPKGRKRSYPPPHSSALPTVSADCGPPPFEAAELLERRS